MSDDITFNEIDDFDNIPDLRAALLLMKAWGLKHKAIDKPGAIRLLIDHWLTNIRPPSPVGGDGNFTVNFSFRSFYCHSVKIGRVRRAAPKIVESGAHKTHMTHSNLFEI